jgi:hypothetical protein
VRIRAHPADDPRGGRAACLEAEHAGAEMGGWISRRVGGVVAGRPEEGKKTTTQPNWGERERERVEGGVGQELPRLWTAGFVVRGLTLMGHLYFSLRNHHPL